MSDYVNVSRAAVTLASGRPLAPGEADQIDPKDPHDQGLVNDGLLVVAETAEETPPAKALPAKAETGKEKSAS